MADVIDELLVGLGYEFDAKEAKEFEKQTDSINKKSNKNDKKERKRNKENEQALNVDRSRNKELQAQNKNIEKNQATAKKSSSSTGGALVPIPQLQTTSTDSNRRDKKKNKKKKGVSAPSVAQLLALGAGGVAVSTFGAKGGAESLFKIMGLKLEQTIRNSILAPVKAIANENILGKSLNISGAGVRQAGLFDSFTGQSQGSTVSAMANIQTELDNYSSGFAQVSDSFVTSLQRVGLSLGDLDAEDPKKSYEKILIAISKQKNKAVQRELLRSFGLDSSLVTLTSQGADAVKKKLKKAQKGTTDEISGAEAVNETSSIKDRRLENALAIQGIKSAPTLDMLGVLPEAMGDLGEGIDTLTGAIYKLADVLGVSDIDSQEAKERYTNGQKSRATRRTDPKTIEMKQSDSTFGSRKPQASLQKSEITIKLENASSVDVTAEAFGSNSTVATRQTFNGSIA